ncbi:MAG TPA: hypothetical protein VK824_04110, partial [Planctomycetota bacterium]|nr:hypothetical protein [Planctomycetota bacterium]
YLAGHVGLRGWRDWAPREAVDWIAVVALLGLLVGAAGLVRRWPQRLRGVLRVIVAAGAVWLVAGKPMERALGEAGMWQQVALLGAGIALAWSALEGLATPAVRAGPLLLLWLLAAGCAAVLAISGSLVLGKLAGALAAALGAAIVLGVRRPGAATLLGAAPPVALTLGALLVAGMRLASVPPRAALALLAAAVSAFAVRLLAGRAARSRGATGDGPGTLVAQLLVAGVLAGTAFSLALAASPPLDEAGY